MVTERSSHTALVGVYILLLIIIVTGTQSDSYTLDVAKSGDAKKCLAGMGKRVTRFGVLPGSGWDNLRNKVCGLVVSFNYSECVTTDDGNYLIPDNVFTVPIKTSQVEVQGEYFHHWSEYTSTTSPSINVGAGFNGKLQISGSFSFEKERVKKNQIANNAVTTRVQARYIRYSAKLQQTSQLNPAFRQQIKNIAENIQKNFSSVAEYESQVLVRDFGTHVVSSVDAGAVVSQVDEIKSSFLKSVNKDRTKIITAARTSFLRKFNFFLSSKYEESSELIRNYETNKLSSLVHAQGGPIFKPNNYSLNDWASEVKDNLVAIDRSGSPIYELINWRNFPEYSPPIVYATFQYVRTAVEEYYRFNTYRGCTKLDSPNFSYMANFDDGTCSNDVGNYTFGGIYQKCTQTGQLYKNICTRQKNPLTGVFSCPKGYESVFLLKGHTSSSETRQRCTSCGFLWLSTCCSYYYVYGTAYYETYWCVGTGQNYHHAGFLFGGIYTSTIENPLTQEHECPLYFYPLTMGDDIKVCVSDDFELGFRYSIAFAGLFSCKSGNPLAIMKEEGNKSNKNDTKSIRSYLISANSELWPHACPTGYSMHLAALAESCEVNYCVKSMSFSKKEFPRIRRPPFIELPHEAFLKANSDNGTYLSQTGANQLSKGSDYQATSKFEEKKIIIALSALLSVALIAILGIFFGFCIRARRKGIRMKNTKNST
ncbi:macrophage-expressed gene 1 protein-like [Saccostrea echinata]|uniref:macrophage-expressed gene 1 protein-like n=1 Tax=Saccostrea echinata TaxID=191078 RepID=UPI002A817EEF|nr:macrophage-expressed gene 1 protein-like [Saccostrea echinata]